MNFDDAVLSERYRDARSLSALSPVPALVGNVAFGTAGWTDPTLVKGGVFYPRGVRSAEGRLRHYAEHFPMVEVDASYYSILSPSVSERWLSWTPPDFAFNVKAHSSLTGHPVDLMRLPQSLRAEVPPGALRGGRAYARDLPQAVVSALWDSFELFVRPLSVAGRLGCVMLQFPPWFVATRGNARTLEQLAERLNEFRLSVEFRHPSWLATQRRERVFELLKRLRMCYVVVDEPDTKGGGVPPVSAVTNAELALFRFHGHNLSGWRKGASVAQRFNYLYSPIELQPWAKRTLAAAQHAERVHVVFNNCVRDFAVVGAKDLAVLVERQQALDASG